MRPLAEGLTGLLKQPRLALLPVGVGLGTVAVMWLCADIGNPSVFALVAVALVGTSLAMFIASWLLPLSGESDRSDQRGASSASDYGNARGDRDPTEH
jgi:hypothetical protein